MKPNPRILISNDDGIYAPGLAILERIAREFSDDVWVVAPEVEQSGAGHSLTVRAPLKFSRLEECRYAVSGTPTDCVLMAVSAIVTDGIPFDLVLSGVNRGGNVAEDITHSGTVAAAMEGTLCGIPSIAFSQALDFGVENPTLHWETAEAHGARMIRHLLAAGFEPGTMYNVNFPDCEPDAVKGVKCVGHGKRGLPKQLTRTQDPSGRPYYWMSWADDNIHPSRPDSDIKWMNEGYITVTPICLDLSNYRLIERLKTTLEA
jgi:5'-nucleotidase